MDKKNVEHLEWRQQLTIEQRIAKLVSQGFSMDISCYGKGRKFEMTYSALILKHPAMLEDQWYGASLTVKGDTLGELLDNAEHEINSWEVTFK